MAMIPNGQILPDSDRGAAITPQPPVINNNISCGCGGCGGGETKEKCFSHAEIVAKHIPLRP